ncbi:MAG: ubiquinone/menaquinone biosynthesis methyltransferase [Acidimicrobiaceae bacterium]|nr:ubiquinone/menaquinone biosynthesis methyltransferase [Acidimicrobiaceae bacterium]
MKIDPENLPEGDDKRAAVRSLFDRIAGRYDMVNRVITFGLDVRWRRSAVSALDLSAGSIVLDLACGTGDLCRETSRVGMVPIGVDLSMRMLIAAHTDAPLLHGDVLALPVQEGAVDGAVCGFALRNLVELPGFFEELARVIRPGGRISLLDAAEPENKLLRRGHRIYFQKIVPRIGGLLSDRAAYRYLPKSLAYMPAWTELKQQLESAGFVDIERRVFLGAHLITATRGGLEAERIVSLTAASTRGRGPSGPVSVANKSGR